VEGQEESTAATRIFLLDLHPPLVRFLSSSIDLRLSNGRIKRIQPLKDTLGLAVGADTMQRYAEASSPG